MDSDFDAKRDYSAATRQEMADAHEALPDGSFPIRNMADLHNAIQAYGRAKDKEAAKRHIIKRARALGAAEVIPEAWMGKSDINEDLEEKAVVRVSADGKTVKCAKGLGGDKCGYKAGDKVCGACGAVAVMTKGVGDGDYGVGMEREMDEEAPDEDQAELRKKKPAKDSDAASEDTESGDASETTEDELARQANELDAKKKAMRRRRMGKMGVKDAQDDAFLCAVERKVLTGGAEPCEGCNGGCFPVKGGADLLEVEALAEDLYEGDVLDSGYSEKWDTFVVDLRTKDGDLIEAYFKGDGKPAGWHPMPEEALTNADDEVISADEAVLLAVEAVKGKALSLGVQIIEGKTAYCVEVDGEDGYSHDVFVSIDGKVLGADTWEYATSDEPAGETKTQEQLELEVALMEFEQLAAEAELRDQGII